MSGGAESFFCGIYGVLDIFSVKTWDEIKFKYKRTIIYTFVSYLQPRPAPEPNDAPQTSVLP